MEENGWASYIILYVPRDELTSERDIDSTYYLYEKGGMLYGHYEEGTWQFGLKVCAHFVTQELRVGLFNKHLKLV